MRLKLEYTYDHIGADDILRMIKDFENRLYSKDRDIALIELKITSE